MNEGSVYWFGICTVYLFDRHSYSCFFCSWVFIFVFFIKPSNFYFRFIYFLFVYIFFSFNTKDLSLLVLALVRSSRLEVLLGEVVLKICSKFTGEHGCRSTISINSPWGVLWKKCPQELPKIQRKAPVPKSLFEWSCRWWYKLLWWSIKKYSTRGYFRH